MADIKVSWSKDPSSSLVANYVVALKLNGGAEQLLTVPSNAAADAAGYSALYSSLSPTPGPLVNGDVVGIVGVKSVDTFGQSSPVVVCSPPSISIVVVPPAPTGPVGVTAAQV